MAKQQSQSQQQPVPASIPTYRENPYMVIKTEAEKLGIEPRLDLKILRKPTGQTVYAYLDTWGDVPVDDLQYLESKVQEVYGGGEYLVEFNDINRNVSACKYLFKIDGYPKSPQIVQPQVVTQTGTISTASSPAAQQTVSAPSPSIQESYLDRIDRLGIRRPFYRYMDYSDSEAIHWREKYEELQKQFERWKDEINQEKREKELLLQQKEYEMRIQKMQDEFQKRLDDISRKLEESGGKPKDSDFQVKLVEMQQKIMEIQAQNMQNSNRSMMEWLGNYANYQKEHIQTVLKAQEEKMRFYEQYFEKLDKILDPKRNLEVHDMYAKQQVNWINLLTQIVTSGLFESDKGNVPAWAMILKGGIENIQGLAGKYLDVKQKELEVASRQLVSANKQQIPAFNFQQITPVTPALTSNQGFGNIASPSGNKIQQTQQVKQTENEEPKQPVNNITNDQIIIAYIINKIKNMIEAKEKPERIGRELFVDIDWLIYQGLLPAEIEKELEDPENALRGICTAFGIQIDDEYFKQIVLEYKRVLKEMTTESGNDDIEAEIEKEAKND